MNRGPYAYIKKHSYFKKKVLSFIFISYFCMLLKVYVGGTPRDITERAYRKGAFLYQNLELPQNFVGCLKKVSR